MKPLWKSLLHALGLATALLLLYFISGPLDLAPAQNPFLGGYGHQLLLDIGIAITLAVSLNLILGIAGQFSLGHAGFAAAGAYTSVLIAGRYFEPLLAFLTQGPFHFSTTHGFQLIMVLGMLAGALVAAILGLLVGLPTLRLRGDYLAIATLGFGEILAVFFQNFRLNDSMYFGGSTGLSLTSMRGEWAADKPDMDLPIVQAVQNYMDNTNYYVGAFAVFAVALITIYIVHNIKYATSGRALLALREDPVASESVGVPTTRYKVASFVIGAALAGLAGGLISHHKSLINPESFRFMRSIEIVAMVILGGQGSITGSILAAILLTLVPEILRTGKGWSFEHLQSWHWDSLANFINGLDIEKWRMVLYSLFIILAMLFRPQGLFGRYELTDLARWLWRKLRRTHPASPSQAAPAISSELPPGVATLSAENEPGELPAPILSADHVTMQFGGLKAVDDVHFDLYPGELVGLIGPNGAGKTTVFNVLTGVYRPTRGDVRVQKASIANHPSRTRIITAIALGIPLFLAGLWILAISPRFREEPAALWGLIAAGLFLAGVGVALGRPLFWKKARIIGLKPHSISRLGVARTFQNIRLFGNLSVIDNVQIAQHAHHKQGIPSAIFRIPPFYREEAISRRHALGYLGLFDLAHLADERASSLSYGDQRRLEIARALATRPRILMLDEPAAGMNPTEKRELMEMIQSLRARFGLTILLIEHDMKVIMGICQRILVLDYGKPIASGTPDEIRKNPAVIRAYLGTAKAPDA